MSDQELRFTLTAITNNFTQKFQEAGNQVRTFSQGVQGQLSGIRDAVGNLGNIMAALGAVKLAALVDEATMVNARLKDVTGSAAAAETAQGQLFSSAQRLQVGYADLAGAVAKMVPAIKEMGGTTGQAQKLAEILATTAKLSGASSQEAAAAQTQFAQALASGVLQGDELKSILENNSTLARAMAQGLGVGVGQLRELGAQGQLTADKVAGALLGQYDQILAKADELPVTVGGAWTQVQNSFQSFVSATNDGTGVFTALSALLSGLSKVIDAVRGAFASTSTESEKLARNNSIKEWGNTVGAIFVYVIDLARAVWEAISATGRAIGALAAAAAAAASGDFTAAAAIMREAWGDAEQSWERIKNLTTGGEGSVSLTYAKGPAMAAPTEPDAPLTSTAGGGKGKKDKKDKADKPAKVTVETQIPAIEAELEAERVKFMQMNNMREMNKVEELKALEEIAARYQLSATDAARLRKMQTQAEVAALRELAQTGRALDEQSRRERYDTAMASVEAAATEAQQRQQLGLISQQQLLEQERAFEEQRMQIRREFLLAQLSAISPDRDPVQYAQILAQIEALDAQYQARKREMTLRSVQASPADNVVKGMETAMQQSIANMLNGTQTLRQGLTSIWQGIRASVVGEIGKMVAARVAAFAREKLLTMASIGADAAKAGAGAAASQAAIPIVGPSLALASMAAVMGAVLGLQGSIPSAEGGWSIPAGTNPIAQLHEREMVLPAQYADVIRGMGDNGGSGGAAFAPSITVQAMDARSVAQALRRGGALESALRGLHRDFVKV